MLNPFSNMLVCLQSGRRALGVWGENKAAYKLPLAQQQQAFLRKPGKKCVLWRPVEKPLNCTFSIDLCRQRSGLLYPLHCSNTSMITFIHHLGKDGPSGELGICPNKARKITYVYLNNASWTSLIQMMYFCTKKFKAKLKYYQATPLINWHRRYSKTH